MQFAAGYMSVPMSDICDRRRGSAVRRHHHEHVRSSLKTLPHTHTLTVTSVCNNLRLLTFRSSGMASDCQNTQNQMAEIFFTAVFALTDIFAIMAIVGITLITRYLKTAFRVKLRLVVVSVNATNSDHVCQERERAQRTFPDPRQG